MKKIIIAATLILAAATYANAQNQRAQKAYNNMTGTSIKIEDENGNIVNVKPITQNGEKRYSGSHVFGYDQKDTTKFYDFNLTGFYVQPSVGYGFDQGIYGSVEGGWRWNVLRSGLSVSYGMAETDGVSYDALGADLGLYADFFKWHPNRKKCSKFNLSLGARIGYVHYEAIDKVLFEDGAKLTLYPQSNSLKVGACIQASIMLAQNFWLVGEGGVNYTEFDTLTGTRKVTTPGISLGLRINL